MHNVSNSNAYRADALPGEQLSAVLLELQANRTILAELVIGYNVFRFTGGDVPTAPWRLTAITAYLERPLAAERVLTSNAQRYVELATDVMALGQVIGSGGPRTLRCRRDLANRFSKAGAEIRRLGLGFEAGLTAILRGQGESTARAGRLKESARSEEVFSSE